MQGGLVTPHARSLARSERAELCDLFEQVGPDAPTLCDPWTTRDLAAHLIIRESRADAALGIALSPFAGWTGQVQRHTAKDDWDSLVGRVRTGPPRWSPARLGAVDDAVNTVEFFVHHEDVRRAQSDWQPRSLPDSVQRLLWAHLKQRARFHVRSSRVAVTLERPDGGQFAVPKRPGAAVSGSVTLVGDAAELTVYLNGRTRHARVQVLGDPEAVAAFDGTDLSV